MDKLSIMLLAGAFAATAGAQTGVVSPGTVADHGTLAMHAAESAKNVATSTSTQGLSGSNARQQAVKEATKVADHGTQTVHADEALRNVSASRAQAITVAGSKAGQEAVQQASKGATR